MIQQWFLCASTGVLLATVTLAAETEGQRIDANIRTVAVTPRVKWVRDVRGRMVLRPDLAVADRILVVCSGTSAVEFERAARVAGGRLLRTVPRMGLGVVELRQGADMSAAAAACRALPFVTHAGPDRMCHLRFVPNDPELPQQGHLTPIKAREAWDIERGSPNVVIAVVDSGVDFDHPDIAGRIWTNPDEIANGSDDDGNNLVDDLQGWDFSPGSPDLTDPSPDPDGDDNNGDGEPDEQVSHGTLVAGIAAATGNNAVGVAGIDWGARIMAIQVFPDDGSTPVSRVAQGIDYAAFKGADIINLSLGTDFFEATFTPSVDRARAAGALIVTAAGNVGQEYTADSNTWESPICNDGPTAADNFVLGLTATTNTDRKASFAAFDSSGRPFIDVCAPGVGVYGPVYQDGSSGFSAFYGSDNGTSFSTPQASGLAALLLAQDPTLTHDDLISIIRGSADNIDSLNAGLEGKLGAGRINCEAALLALDSPPSPVTNLVAADTPFDSGGSVTISWSKSADDGGGENDVTGYDVLRATSPGGPFTSRGTPGPGVEEFVDSTTDGVDYFYMVRAIEDDQQTDSAVVGPVQSVDNRTNVVGNFPAGRIFLSFLARPLDQDPAALFGAVPPQSLRWARFDPGIDAYRKMSDDPTHPFLQIDLGIGYWLELLVPTVVGFPGHTASPGPFDTALAAGWNQAGNPFDGTVDFAGLRFVISGQERTLSEAALLGVMNPSGWLYDSASGQHVMLNEFLVGAETEIPSSAGFWMLALQNTTVRIRGPAGTTAASAGSPAAQADQEGEGWQGRLVARAGALTDSYNFFGRDARLAAAADAANPPAPPGGHVDLYFVAGDVSSRQAGAGRLASRFVADEQDEMEWPFVVDCTVPMTEVRVSCPDLSALPRRYRVLLTDLDAGRNQLLRAQHVYTYRTGAVGSSRRFLLTVTPEISGTLAITGLTALPGRGTTTDIGFSLSRGATAAVEIVNVAGRRVRVVSRGELLASGRSTVAWDGRTDGGGMAPAGAYLVRVRAATEDGQSANAVGHVYVRR